MSLGANYHIVRETVNSTAQDLTTSWADLGSEISMLGYDSLGVWVNLDINSSVNPRIRALAKLDSAGTDEYYLPIQTISSSDVKVEDHYIEFNEDSDQKIILEIETSGHIPYIQLQVQTETVGGTAGQIDGCVVTKRLKK